MMFSRHVIFCGAFPPPVNGLAMVNRSVYELFASLDMIVSTIDIAARGGLARIILHRFAALLRTSWLLLCPSPSRVLYYALSSGLGQYFDLVAIALARLARVRIVIHHHNFSYLGAPTPAARRVFALATRGHAVHICLCASMATLLRRSYGEDHEVVIVGNAAFIAPDTQAQQRGSADGRVRTGYLGALTSEKGLHDFLDLAEACADLHGLIFTVAGNAPEAGAQARLQALTVRGVVDFRGALYGEEKRNYLRSLDILIFPSRYRHEAQPLVVFEALAAGVTVISHPIACMCDLDGMAGVSLAAEGQLETPLRQALTLSTAARHALARDIAASYQALHQVQHAELKNTFLALFP